MTNILVRIISFILALYILIGLFTPIPYSLEIYGIMVMIHVFLVTQEFRNRLTDSQRQDVPFIVVTMLWVVIIAIVWPVYVIARLFRS